MVDFGNAALYAATVGLESLAEAWGILNTPQFRCAFARICEAVWGQGDVDALFRLLNILSKYPRTTGISPADAAYIRINATERGWDGLTPMYHVRVSVEDKMWEEKLVWVVLFRTSVGGVDWMLSAGV